MLSQVADLLLSAEEPSRNRLPRRRLGRRPRSSRTASELVDVEEGEVLGPAWGTRAFILSAEADGSMKRLRSRVKTDERAALWAQLVQIAWEKHRRPLAVAPAGSCVGFERWQPLDTHRQPHPAGRGNTRS